MGARSLIATVVTALAAAVSAGPTAAQTFGAVPTSQFRDLTLPHDARMLSHFFGPAEGPAGETLALRAKGPIALNVYRPAPGVPQGGSIAVEVLSAQGKTLANWQEPVASFQHPAVQRRLDLPSDQTVHVRLRAVDAAAGGPARARPYTLIAEVWPLAPAATVVRDDSGTPEVSAQLTRPSCSTDAAGTRAEFLEFADRIKRGDSLRALRSVRAVTAGRLLQLKISSGWSTKARPTVVTLFAKHVGDGSFMNVCRFEVPQAAAPVVLLAQAPVADESVWRIEVVAPEGQTQGGPASIEVSRTKVLAAPPTLSVSNAWRHGLAHLCFDGALQQVVEVPATEGFGGRSHLSVDLSSVTQQLSAQQRDQVQRAVLQAVSLWVRACAVCRLDNLALVRVDGRVFVHPGLFGPLGPGAAHLRTSPGLTPDQAEWLLRGGLSAGRVGAPIQSRPYVELSKPPSDEFSAYCRLAADERKRPTLFVVKRTLCTPEPNPADGAKIRVTVNDDGRTYCGRSKNIIACRADNELTELNTLDYRFRLVDGPLPGVGAGSVEVDFLHAVLHEMGHWIGLPHVNSGESLMASTMEQSRCIDRATVERLAKGVIRDRPASTGPSPFLYQRAP